MARDSRACVTEDIERLCGAGFGGSSCPVGRGPLFPRPDIHVLTRARAIHCALDAAPGRPDTTPLELALPASVEAAAVGGTSPTALSPRFLTNEATTQNTRATAGYKAPPHKPTPQPHTHT